MADNKQNWAELEFEDEAIQREDLKNGDHIYVDAIFRNNAIYFREEDGAQWVTDFGRVNQIKPVIRSLGDFLAVAGDKELARRNYLTGQVPVDATIAKAKEMCQDNSIDWSKCAWLDNNGEHYATFLKSTKAISTRAKRFRSPVEIQNKFYENYANHLF